MAVNTVLYKEKIPLMITKLTLLKQSDDLSVFLRINIKMRSE